MHGVIDDFAAFGKEVSAADAAQLAGGKLPTDLAADNLLAYWDFNDATAVQPGGPTLTWARTATGFTITYTGTLQSVTNIPGTWQDVAGATSPYTVTPSGAQAYFRSKQWRTRSVYSVAKAGYPPGLFCVCHKLSCAGGGARFESVETLPAEGNETDGPGAVCRSSRKSGYEGSKSARGCG